MLLGIRDELARSRRLRSPSLTLQRLAYLHRGRFLLRSTFSPGRCFATAVVANLGDPTRRFFARFPRRAGRLCIGNLTLTQVMGIAPLRPQTRLAINVCTYANELSIAIRCDPSCFRVSDATDILDELETALRCSAQEG